MNGQIIDYIRKEKATGKTDETIKQNLLSVGWAGQDIEKAFAALNSKTEHEAIFLPHLSLTDTGQSRYSFTYLRDFFSALNLLARGLVKYILSFLFLILGVALLARDKISVELPEGDTFIGLSFKNKIILIVFVLIVFLLSFIRQKTRFAKVRKSTKDATINFQRVAILFWFLLFFGNIFGLLFGAIFFLTNLAGQFKYKLNLYGFEQLGLLIHFGEGLIFGFLFVFILAFLVTAGLSARDAYQKTANKFKLVAAYVLTVFIPFAFFVFILIFPQVYLLFILFFTGSLFSIYAENLFKKTTIIKTL